MRRICLMSRLGARLGLAVVLTAGIVVANGAAAGAAGYTCFGKPATRVLTSPAALEVYPGEHAVVVMIGSGNDYVYDPFTDPYAYAPGVPLDNVEHRSESDPYSDDPPDTNLVCTGAGNDVVMGVGTVDTGAGDDFVEDGRLVDLGAGADRLENWHCAPATIHGGDGDDWIMSSWDSHMPAGNEGISEPADEECPGAGDLVSGDAGNDTLYGGDGQDTITGGPATDAIYGGLGSDTLEGWAGDDTVTGDEGDDTLDGGSGTDRCLAGAELPAGSDTFVKCESTPPAPMSRG